MSFKQIPDEGSHLAQFTKRKIRKAGETDLIRETLKLLTRYEDEDDELLVSELSDLVNLLHRTALKVQGTKHKELFRRLRKLSRRKIKNK